MKNNITLILGLSLLILLSANTISAQGLQSDNNTNTRKEAFQNSIKMSLNNVSSRSMSATFTTGYDEILIESKLENNACIELAQIAINVVDGINQIGTFTNGIAGAGLEIDEGIVLSTGTITEMFTDNNAVLVSEGVSDANVIADMDFDNLDPGGQSTHNESILILDFIVPPGLDGIRVPFQFASDEYPEYVGTQFNDVFGFFVSGPGFEEGTNIALVPGTDIPIAVNSINGGFIADQDNVDAYPATGPVYYDYSQYHIDNTDGTDQGPIVGEYDGYSTILYAEVNGLIPGETYQLKLGIADIADHYGDSGVYIGPLEGLYEGDAIVDCYCDISDYDLDCDKDGVINGEDCDPEDATVAIPGDSCIDSNDDEGEMDDNCICIATGDGTSGGNEGGLESNNRLAQKIAKRNFNKKLRPDKIDRLKANGEIPYKPNAEKKDSDIDLSQIIPTDIWGAYIAESSPDDLVSITNATEIYAADYYLNNIRSAVVLAIKSENGVYEHSKYICDRLDGASLLDVYYSNLQEKQFITYKIETASGLIEYATSFSGYVKDQKFEMENHWNLDKYSFNDKYYNFQIWASSVEKTKSLLITIMDNISNQVALGNLVTGTIPPSFVKNGYYDNGKLHLNMLNKGMISELSFRGQYRETESADLKPFEEEINTALVLEEAITIETGYLYDMGMSIIIDDTHSDELFIADGTWGYDDLNPNSEMLDFQIAPQETIFDNSVYGIERGISISAEVKDYQNIFRSITPKWQSIDLSSFSAISFKASGKGMVQITVVNDQVEDWQDQLSYTITLNEDSKEYQLSISDFSNFESNADLSSINMIMITLIGNNGTYENLSIDLFDLNFNNKSIVSSVKDNTTKDLEFKIYPNPAKDIIEITIPDNKEDVDIMSLINSQGQTLLNKTIIDDRQEIEITIEDFIPGVYYVEIINARGNKTVQRFLKL